MSRAENVDDKNVCDSFIVIRSIHGQYISQRDAAGSNSCCYTGNISWGPRHRGGRFDPPGGVTMAGLDEHTVNNKL